MEIAVLPAWDDNYIFIIHNETEALIIDPTTFTDVDKYLTKNKLKPIAILNTHHHPDHIGGNLELKEKYKLDIYCSEYDKQRVPGASHLLNADQSIELLGLKIKTLDLSGHTLGLIGYYLESEKVVFSGDCIFSLGCGYLFEGTATQMQQALNRIKNLPPETKIYCSHEYTLSNSEFQASIEKSEEFESLHTSIKEKRINKIKTIPTSVAFEKKWNLFLRWDDNTIRNSLDILDFTDSEYVAHIRQRKNNFK